MSFYASFDGHLKIATSGVRIAPPLDLSAIAQATSGKVHIIANTSPGASIIVKLAVAETEPGVEDYAEVFNGDPMPGIIRGESLEGKTLYEIIELSTEDTTAPPVIEFLMESIGEMQDRQAASFISRLAQAAIRRGAGTRTPAAYLSPALSLSSRAGRGARAAVTKLAAITTSASRFGAGIRRAISFISPLYGKMVLPRVCIHLSYRERQTLLTVQQRQVKLEVEE